MRASFLSFNIKKFDILDPLARGASSWTSMQDEAIFASVNLEETPADLMRSSPTNQIVPMALYQIC
jgi:hypothetical protein